MSLRGLALPGAGLAGSGRVDGPGAGGIEGEAEVEEPFEVDRGAAHGPGVTVSVGASESDSPMVVADQPGDGAFDHGPKLTVGVVEVVGASERAGCGEQCVVGVDFDDAAESPWVWWRL